MFCHSVYTQLIMRTMATVCPLVQKLHFRPAPNDVRRTAPVELHMRNAARLRTAQHREYGVACSSTQLSALSESLRRHAVYAKQLTATARGTYYKYSSVSCPGLRHWRWSRSNRFFADRTDCTYRPQKLFSRVGPMGLLFTSW